MKRYSSKLRPTRRRTRDPKLVPLRFHGAGVDGGVLARFGCTQQAELPRSLPSSLVGAVCVHEAPGGHGGDPHPDQVLHLHVPGPARLALGGACQTHVLERAERGLDHVPVAEQGVSEGGALVRTLVRQELVEPRVRPPARTCPSNTDLARPARRRRALRTCSASGQASGSASGSSRCRARFSGRLLSSCQNQLLLLDALESPRDVADVDLLVDQLNCAPLSSRRIQHEGKRLITIVVQVGANHSFGSLPAVLSHTGAYRPERSYQTVGLLSHAKPASKQFVTSNLTALDFVMRRELGLSFRATRSDRVRAVERLAGNNAEAASLS